MEFNSMGKMQLHEEMPEDTVNEEVKHAILTMATKLHQAAHPEIKDLKLQVVEDKGLSAAIEGSIKPLQKDASYDSNQPGGQDKSKKYGSATYFAPIQVHCPHCVWAAGAGDIVKEFKKHEEEYVAADGPSSTYGASASYESDGMDAIPTYDENSASVSYGW